MAPPSGASIFASGSVWEAGEPTTVDLCSATPGLAAEGGFFAGKIVVAGDTYAVIVAPKAEGETQLPWEWADDPTIVGADSTNDGAGNTADLVAIGGGGSSYAAGFCNNLVIAGLDDWVLPAPDQLEVCYRFLKPGTADNDTVGKLLHMTTNGTNPNSDPTSNGYTASSPEQTTVASFQTGGAEAFELAAYWTSAVRGFGSSWAQEFLDGDQTLYSAAVTLYVRAIRLVLLDC